MQYAFKVFWNTMSTENENYSVFWWIPSLSFYCGEITFQIRVCFCLSGLPGINDPTRTPSFHIAVSSSMPDPPALNLWLLLVLFQIAWAWFHYGYEKRNDDDRGNWLANFSSDRPIANMATISPKRGFSVATVAKGRSLIYVLMRVRYL